MPVENLAYLAGASAAQPSGIWGRAAQLMVATAEQLDGLLRMPLVEALQNPDERVTQAWSELRDLDRPGGGRRARE